MHALISADMEGATGVTCPDDVRPGSPQWERFRRLFTGDVKAVCDGFFDAGIEDILVNEAHSSMRNLLLEELDPRVRLLTGHHKAFGMMEGIQQRPELVAFVGYHAGPGEPGVLSHTFVGFEIFSVTLNERPMTEGYLNALLTAEYGARLAVVAGDDLTCADAAIYAPQAQLVAVKEAVDRYTAVCLTPARTSSMLRSAAAAGTNKAEVPPLPAGPYRCEVTFHRDKLGRDGGLRPDGRADQPENGRLHQAHHQGAVSLLSRGGQDRRCRRRPNIRLSLNAPARPGPSRSGA